MSLTQFKIGQINVIVYSLKLSNIRVILVSFHICTVSPFLFKIISLAA